MQRNSSSIRSWRYKNNALSNENYPAITKLAKLKTEDGENQTEQLERWVEHYSKLYTQDLPEHPVMEEVLPSFGVHTELNEEPTEELSEAISALSNGKAPGKYSFPVDIF